MSTPKKAILVRPSVDSPTRISFEWAEQLKATLEKNNWYVIDCKKEMAFSQPVEQVLTNGDHQLFVFYGHGDMDALFGQDEEPVINLQNAYLLKNNAIYVMACFSAQQLGLVTIKEGAHCYLGYNAEVYLNLKFYESLGKCVNSGLVAWLENESLTVLEIHSIIYNAFNSAIDYFALQGNFDWASRLRHNRDALTLLGNSNTVLNP